MEKLVQSTGANISKVGVKTHMESDGTRHKPWVHHVMHANPSKHMRLDALEKIASRCVMRGENYHASHRVLAGLDAHERIQPASTSIERKDNKRMESTGETNRFQLRNQDAPRHRIMPCECGSNVAWASAQGILRDCPSHDGASPIASIPPWIDEAQLERSKQKKQSARHMVTKDQRRMTKCPRVSESCSTRTVEKRLGQFFQFSLAYGWNTN